MYRKIAAVIAIAMSIPLSAKEESISFKQGVNISHWMGQHPTERYADPARFSESDLEWIAEHGYDHIRVPVDGRILLNHNGILIEELVAPFDRAIEWAKDLNVGILFDMHYLPGNDFLEDPEDNLLWSSERYQDLAASLWQQIAKRYLEVGAILRFEVLNEAVAPENEQLNRLNRKIVSAIRKVDADRVIYVSSNLWGKFETAPDVHVFDGDPNIHYAFHFYEPHVFTHQKASWMVDTRETYPKSVSFPTTLYDLDIFPKTHYLGQFQGVPLDADFVSRRYEQLAKWANANDAQILISEFGVIHHADDQSTENWIRAVRESCEEHDFGWTVWDYKGSFGIRRNSRPTAVHYGLFPDDS